MVLDNIRFSWRHTSVILGESLANVTWDIPSDATPGTYRIQHFGYHKELGKSKQYFFSNTEMFSLIPSPYFLYFGVACTMNMGNRALAFGTRVKKSQ